MVWAPSDTQVSAMQGPIATDTRNNTQVRPQLCPWAGLLVIEPTPLTTPTVPGGAWSTAEGAGTPEAIVNPEGQYTHASRKGPYHG
jgi:hypothetical protein